MKHSRTRKLSKRRSSRKVTRRSVRLSKKQRRSLRKMSKRLRNRLSFSDLKDKAKSGLSKMGTSIKSGLNKASAGIKAAYQERTSPDYDINKGMKNLQDAIYNKKLKEINDEWDPQISEAVKMLDFYEKGVEKLNKQLASKQKELDSKTKQIEEFTNKSKILTDEIPKISYDIGSLNIQKNDNINFISKRQEELATFKDKKTKALEKAQEEAKKLVQQQLVSLPSARLRGRRRFSRF